MKLVMWARPWIMLNADFPELKFCHLVKQATSSYLFQQASILGHTRITRTLTSVEEQK